MTRLATERGSGLVAGLALIFAFTFLGLVWLARDVDRSVSNRTAAQSIACVMKDKNPANAANWRCWPTSAAFSPTSMPTPRGASIPACARVISG